jgi:hypothetical protein
VSEVRNRTSSFFDLYSAGELPESAIDDHVEAWHCAGEAEDRPLSRFLGMTEDEYSVWVMSTERCRPSWPPGWSNGPWRQRSPNTWQTCSAATLPIAPPFTYCRTGWRATLLSRAEPTEPAPDSFAGGRGTG